MLEHIGAGSADTPPSDCRAELQKRSIWMALLVTFVVDSESQYFVVFGNTLCS